MFYDSDISSNLRCSSMTRFGHKLNNVINTFVKRTPDLYNVTRHYQNLNHVPCRVISRSILVLFIVTGFQQSKREIYCSWRASRAHSWTAVWWSYWVHWQPFFEGWTIVCRPRRRNKTLHWSTALAIKTKHFHHGSVRQVRWDNGRFSVWCWEKGM